jgi:capsular exopolysaccharide synthesis family protein
VTAPAANTRISPSSLNLHEPAEVRPRLRQELVSFLAPASAEAEQYRTLRHSVERLARESGYQVIALTSAMPGEGKTLTTLNLAGALAQARDARVLVVGADFHRPMLSEYLGLQSLRSPGLADLIASGQRLPEEVIRRVEPLNISILPAGTTSGASYDLLAAPRLQTIFAQLRQQYRYILIDAPPVLSSADARVLGDRVDGFIVVVAAHRTPRKLLTETVRQLAPARIAGFVLNGDDRPLAPYYGY